MTTAADRRTIERLRLFMEIGQQRRWIAEHGGDRAGYIARYGDAGDGGEAIYEADAAELHKLTTAYAENLRIARTNGDPATRS